MKVWVVMPSKHWHDLVDRYLVDRLRVFDNDQAAKADWTENRWYGEREVLSKTVCPTCGKANDS